MNARPQPPGAGSCGRRPLGITVSRQLAAVPVHRSEQKSFGIFRLSPGRPFPDIDAGSRRACDGRQLVDLAAFFVQADPGQPPLHIHVFDPHLHGRAHSCEASRGRRQRPRARLRPRALLHGPSTIDDSSCLYSATTSTAQPPAACARSWPASSMTWQTYGAMEHRIPTTPK